MVNDDIVTEALHATFRAVGCDDPHSATPEQVEAALCLIIDSAFAWGMNTGEIATALEAVVGRFTPH